MKMTITVRVEWGTRTIRTPDLRRAEADDILNFLAEIEGERCFRAFVRAAKTWQRMRESLNPREVIVAKVYNDLKEALRSPGVVQRIDVE